MEEATHKDEHILLTSLGTNAIPTEYQIDRRSPDEQDSDPFVESEYHWL